MLVQSRLCPFVTFGPVSLSCCRLATVATGCGECQLQRWTSPRFLLGRRMMAQLTGCLHQRRLRFCGQGRALRLPAACSQFLYLKLWCHLLLLPCSVLNLHLCPSWFQCTWFEYYALFTSIFGESYPSYFGYFFILARWSGIFGPRSSSSFSTSFG